MIFSSKLGKNVADGLAKVKMTVGGMSPYIVTDIVMTVDRRAGQGEGSRPAAPGQVVGNAGPVKQPPQGDMIVDLP